MELVVVLDHGAVVLLGPAALVGLKVLAGTYARRQRFLRSRSSSIVA